MFGLVIGMAGTGHFMNNGMLFPSLGRIYIGVTYNQSPVECHLPAHNYVLLNWYIVLNEL